MELIDRIRKDIDDRLEELRPQIEEIPRLEAALAALETAGGSTASGASGERRRRPRGQAPGSRAGSGGPRRRARRGQRREELLQLIRGNPEMTIAEAARQMGVSAPQVSTLVRRLREEGVLERADGRFVVSEPTTFSDGAGSAGREDPAGDGDAAVGGEASEPEVAEVEGPGVEGLRPAEGGDEVTDAPEAARDEAGRPQAT